MTETRAQKDKSRFEHIVDELLALDPDDPLFKALTYEGIGTYGDLLDLVHDPDRIDDLGYEVQDQDGKISIKKITKVEKGRLKAFARVNGYFKTFYKETPGMSDTEFEIRQVTADMYDDVRTDNSIIPVQRRSKHSGNIAKPQAHPNATAAAFKDPVSEITKGIRKDINAYSEFRLDHMFETWYHSSRAVASSHQMLPVFDPNYSPGPGDAKDAFEVMQVFIYSAFTRKVLTSKGKSVIRK